MQALAPTTTGVLWKNEEGNVVSVRQAHALFVVTPKKRSHLEDTSFAQSRDPCTSIVTKLIPYGASRGTCGASGRRKSAAQADGIKRMSVARRSRYRGRENLCKQEEPAPGSRSTGRMRGSPRVTASLVGESQHERVVRDA